MGPLTRRIQRRRARLVVTTLIRRAEQDARIAVALSRDEAKDGGLLIHTAIEKAEANGA